MEYLASRRTRWVEARIAVPAVFTFTTLTLIATLLHLDRFHFNSASQLAQSAAWLWLGIYAIVPPAMILLWLRQCQVPGLDSNRSTPLPILLRIILGSQAVIMLAWGFLLFIDPALFSFSWPWKLTVLTSQAVGAWLIGIGVFAAHALIENDYSRIRVGLISYFAFGCLEIVALLRYPASLTSSWSTWFYVGLIVSILVAGFYSTKRIVNSDM